MRKQLSYAMRLLDAARRGLEWRSAINGQTVSANPWTRLEQGTPINEFEAKAFAFVLANPRFLELVIEYAEEARASGRAHLSARLVIERARWELLIAVRSTDEDFLINDHVIPTIGRLANEHMGCDFFTARSQWGEPAFTGRGPKRAPVRTPERVASSL